MTLTELESDIASERCDGRKSEAEGLSTALPLISTARGQHPASSGGYELPSTRVYLCHNPAPGSPSGYFYMHGEEFVLDPAGIETGSLWGRLMAELPKYSCAEARAHTKKQCDMSREYIWAVDENFNIVIAPQWEVPDKEAVVRYALADSWVPQLVHDESNANILGKINFHDKGPNGPFWEVRLKPKSFGASDQHIWNFEFENGQIKNVIDAATHVSIEGVDGAPLTGRVSLFEHRGRIQWSAAPRVWKVGWRPTWFASSKLLSLIETQEIDDALSKATLAGPDRAPMPVETLRKLMWSRQRDADWDMRGLRKKCGLGIADLLEGQMNWCAGGRLGNFADESSCWLCALNVIKHHMDSFNGHVETKHGDLLPGATPLRKAQTRRSRPKEPQVEGGEAFGKSFGAGATPPTADVIVEGPFRGPARGGGEVYGCLAKGSTQMHWTVNDMSGYSLFRVPPSIMETRLEQLVSDPKTATQHQMESAADKKNAYWFKNTFDDFSPLSHPDNLELELCMQQLCKIANLMGLPGESTLQLIGHPATQHVSDCARSAADAPASRNSIFGVMLAAFASLAAAILIIFALRTLDKRRARSAGASPAAERSARDDRAHGIQLQNI